MKNKNFIIFDKKLYELIGWSIIDFPAAFKDYPETTEQILQNAIFYSKKYGVTYLDLYKEIEDFIKKYANTYKPYNSDYIFKSGVFIKGTFVYKLVKDETL